MYLYLLNCRFIKCVSPAFASSFHFMCFVSITVVKYCLRKHSYFYIFLTVHLSISLHNDQLDAHLHYFTIRPLHSSTCFEHYMFVIRRLKCIDAASGIVRPVSGRPGDRLTACFKQRRAHHQEVKFF